MNRPNPTVLVLHDTPAEVSTALSPRFDDCRVVYVTDADEVMPAMRRHQPAAVLSIKCPGLPGPVHGEAVRSPGLQWLHVGGSGFDHLLPLDADLPLITNSAGVLSPYLAETVLGAMLGINGNFPRYQRQAEARLWRPIPFRPLSEQSLLVVGLGNIGEEVARRAAGLGMRVIATRRTPRPSPSVEQVFAHGELPRIVGDADFVSVHVRLDESTHHLFDAGLINRMRRGAILINTSRGPVVDERALLQALDEGHLGGAYLDVFETEPLPEDSPLWGREDVVMTPHAADQIADWPLRFAQLFADNLDRWRRGEPLLNVVFDPQR